MAKYELLNGEIVRMSPEDEAARIAEETQWETVEKYERAWETLREVRNRLLQESDWVNQPDVTPTNLEEWHTFRQALRDLTLNEDPFKIVFPVDPTGKQEVWYAE